MTTHREVYFDNAATTQVLEPVKEVVGRTMELDYANPSAMHKKGVEAENYVKQAQAVLARILKAEEKEIIFTSGGTESNNLAIIGTAMANRRMGKHIITSAIEHPSVSNAVKLLEENGFRVTRIPVDSHGILDLKRLEGAVSEDTILVSIMYVNNEIGALEPMEEIIRIVRAKRPEAIIHADAVQAFGKMKIFPGRMGIDLLSASAHKLHGPKGVGFLYKSKRIKVKPVSFGGGQQDGMRSGTLNVPGIAGMTKAAELIVEGLEKETEKLWNLKRSFSEGLLKLPEVSLNSLTEEEKSAPHIVSAVFKGVRSEVLLHALEEEGIYASAGSACAAHKASVSPTLSGIGLSRADMDSTLRFSLSILNSMEDVTYCLEKLEILLKTLRRFVRR